MFFVRNDAALGIEHFVGQAAGLVAVAPVGAAPGVRVADEALARVGHAQRPMHEKLDRRAGLERVADGGNLRQVQLAGRDDLREAHVLQKPGFFGRADVGLCAGVQLDGG